MAIIASATAGPATAAELRIEFKELAAIAQQALGGATLRLHNAPASGLLDFSQGSYVAIGSTQVPIAVPARTFPIAGGTYAYYVNDINSTAVAFEAESFDARVDRSSRSWVARTSWSMVRR